MKIRNSITEQKAGRGKMGPLTLPFPADIDIIVYF